MMKQINSMMRHHLTRGERQRQLREHAWSVDILGALIHTLFRSRGFATRRLSHFLSDAFETTALFYVADPQLMHSGYKLSLAFLISILSTASIDQFYRRLMIRNQEPSMLMLHAISQIVTFVVFALVSTTLQIESFTLPLIVLFGSKLICASVIAATNIVTIPISTVQRIYFPPLINFAAAAACLLIHIATRFLSNLWGFYFLIFATFSVKLFIAIYPLRYAHKAAKMRRLESPKVNVPVKKIGFYDPTWLNVLLLFLLQISALATPMLMSRSFYRSLPVTVALVVSAYLLIAASLLGRPFKTIYIESVRALRREQWDLLRVKVRLATIISGAGYLFFLGINIVVLTRSPNLGVLLGIFWASLFVFNTLFIQRSAVLTMERELILPVLTMRLLAMPLVYFLADPTSGMALVLVVFVECSLTLVFISRAWPYDLVSYAQTKLYQSKVQFESPATKPADFLLKHAYFEPKLRSLGFPSKLYRVDLTRKLSQAEISSFATKLVSELGPQNPFMFISGLELLIWCTDGTPRPKLSTQLLLKFPLVIFKISEVDNLVDALYSQTSPRVESASLGSSSLKQSVFLTKRLSELMPGVWFKWWVFEDGAWSSSSGRPDSATSGALFRLVEAADQAQFFTKNWSYVPGIGNQKFIAFKPFTRVSAVLEIERSSNVELALANMAAEQFAALLKSPPYDISPKDWFVLESFLRDISAQSSSDTLGRSKSYATGNGILKIARTRFGSNLPELHINSAILCRESTPAESLIETG